MGWAVHSFENALHEKPLTDPAILARKFSKPVSVRFDNDKGFHKFSFRVSFQNLFEFGVDGILSGRQETKIKDAYSERFYENQAAEVSVARDEYSSLFVRRLEQVFIVGLEKPDLSYRNNVVP